MEKEKGNFIDVIRGLAIFFMVWGHVIQCSYANSDFNFFKNPVFKFIYTFHMPLFMLISGYCLNFSFKRNLNDLLIHKVISIGQPLLVFSFIDILISHNYKQIFSGKWFHNCLSIWFLWAVLVSSIIVSIILKKNKTVLKQVIALGISFPIIILLPQYSLNLFMYPYFIIGFCYGYYKVFCDNCINKLKYFKYLIIPVYIILYIFFEERHYIYISGIYNGVSLKDSLMIDIYRYITGFFGSISIILISKLVYDYLRKFNFWFLSNLGIYSLQIYLLQRILIENIYARLLKNIFTNRNILIMNQKIYNFLITPVIAICFSILLLGVSYILTKYLGFILFNRKNKRSLYGKK